MNDLGNQARSLASPAPNPEGGTPSILKKERGAWGHTCPEMRLLGGRLARPLISHDSACSPLTAPDTSLACSDSTQAPPLWDCPVLQTRGPERKPTTAFKPLPCISHAEGQCGDTARATLGPHLRSPSLPAEGVFQGQGVTASEGGLWHVQSWLSACAEGLSGVGRRPCTGGSAREAPRGTSASACFAR